MKNPATLSIGVALATSSIAMATRKNTTAIPRSVTS